MAGLDLSIVRRDIQQERNVQQLVRQGVDDALAARKEARRNQRTLSAQNTPAAIGSGGRGGFAAARVNRLTGDLAIGQRSADQDLSSDNRVMRARMRQLALNNPHIVKWLGMLVQNVPGPKGVLMQAAIRNQNGVSTAATKLIGKRIEEAWAEWCEAGSCTADGRFTFTEQQHAAIETWGREGENLVKFVYGRDLNRFGFALQSLDNDQLDDNMMMMASNGNQVRMGVEVNTYRRPQAYWLFNDHPYDTMPGSRERKRIPAELIVHTAVFKRPGQTRGYTPASSVILSINHYDGFEEATLVAARTSAAKLAYIEQPESEMFTGDDDEEDDGAGNNSDGTMFSSGMPGEIDVLPPGQKMNFIDPKFPTNTHEPFTRACLRNVATGLLVSYPSLGNDLSGVNFSSIRAGLLEERDAWRVIQQWFINHFCKPIFKEWLRMALLTVLSDITLTPEQQRQFVWRPRGWEWVDPRNDGDASVLEVENGFDTRTNILAEKGMDFEETMQQLAEEKKYIDGLGLQLGSDLAGDQAGKGVAAGAEADAEQVEGAADGDNGKSGGTAKGGK